ncbi:MAG: protein kinase [Planctomycetes bacterium]|nr:protein kinase [Planctomycetota bacterium]
MAVTQQLQSAITNYPLPLAQALRRAVNAKSSQEQHNGAYYFFESALKLSASAQLGVYFSLGCPHGPLNQLIENLTRPSAGHWLALLRECSAYLATRQDSGLLPLHGVHERLTRKQGMPAVKAFLEFAARSADKQEGRHSFKVLDFFDAVVSYRNQELGHGAMRERGFYAEAAPLLLEAGLEAINALRPVGDLQFVVARDVVDPRTQKASRRFDVLRGDGLHLPLESSQPQDAEIPAGRLLLAAGVVRVQLHPLLVYEIDRLDRDRVGFLNHVAAQGRGDTQKLKRVEYLDYDSGDRLEGHDALSELAALLSRLRGQPVNAEAVALLSQSGSEVAAAQPAPGSQGQFIGDFELIEELGRGGMGIVYKARQNSLRRIVALKVLPPGLAGDPVSVARFKREIAALGRCDHPNVVKVLTAGQDGERHFYAMEYVEGSDLAQVCGVLSHWKTGSLREGHILKAITDSRAHRSSASGTNQPHRDSEPAPLVPKAAEIVPEISEGRDYFTRLAEILSDAALGVQHLHEHGIIHRDLKPANVMLTGDGKRAVIMDLGLAQLQDRSLSLTASSVKILGTLRYMPPEQLQHQMLEVTPKADVYSLGATLYELAALAPMFDGDTEARLMQQVLQEEPKPARSHNGAIPRDLETIITVAAAKAPNDRYATAGALAADLRAFARGEPISARAPSTFHYLKLFYRKNTRLVQGLAAALVILLALTAWFIVSLDESRAQAERSAAVAREKEAQATTEAERANKAELDAKEKAAAAQKARDEANAQKSVAEAKTREVEAALKEAARNLQQIHMERGKAAAERGEPALALQHFAQAARIAEDLGDGERFAQARDLFCAQEQRQPMLLWQTHASGLMRMEESICVSADGRIMAGRHTGVAVVVETATGRTLREFPQPSACSAAQLSPDGTCLFLALADSASLFSVSTGALIGRPIALPFLHAAEFSHDSKRLTLVVGQCEVIEIDAASGSELSRKRLERGPEVSGVALSPDGAHVAAWMKDKRVEVFETATLKRLCSIQIGTQDSPCSIALTLGAAEVLLSTSQGRLFVWRTSDSALLAEHDGLLSFGRILCVGPAGMAAALRKGGGVLLFEGDWAKPRRIETPAMGALGSCFMPDGRTLVIGRVAAAPLFLDLAGGKNLVHLPGLQAAPVNMEWSPDQRYVAVTSWDRTITIVEGFTGAVVRVLNKVAIDARALSWLPDCRRLACGGFNDGRVLVLDALSGELVQSWQGFGKGESVIDIEASPDGRALFACSHKQVQRFEVDSSDSGRRFGLPAVEQFAFVPEAMRVSQDGTALTLTNSRGLVVRLAADDGSLLMRMECGNKTAQFIAMDDDGSRIALALGTGEIRVCDLGSGSQSILPVKNLDEVSACSFGPGNEFLLANVRKGVLAIDIQSGLSRQLLTLHDRGGSYLRLGKDSRSLLVATYGGVLSLFALEASRSLQLPALKSKQVFELFGIRGTEWVAIGAEGTTGAVYDCASGTPVAESGAKKILGAGYAQSPDGRKLLCCGLGGDVEIFDIAQRRFRVLCRVPEGYGCLSSDFSPDGSTVALAFTKDSGESAQSFIRFVDAQMGQTLKDVLTESGKPLVFVRFTSDGKRFIAGRLDGTAGLFESADGSLIRSFGTASDQSLAFDFDAQGGRLLLPGAELSVEVVDVTNGQVRGVLNGHEKRVMRAVFSADRKRIATCAPDGTVRIWDASSAQQIARTVTTTRNNPAGLTFALDDRYVIHMDSERRIVAWDCAGLDATARLDALDAESLQALARMRTGQILQGFEVENAPAAEVNVDWLTPSGRSIVEPLPQAAAVETQLAPKAALAWLEYITHSQKNRVVGSAVLAWRRDHAAMRFTVTKANPQRQSVAIVEPWKEEHRVDVDAWYRARMHGDLAGEFLTLREHEESGRWQEALKLASNLLKKDSANASLRFRAARAALRAKWMGDAITLFEAVLEKEPENPAALAGAAIADSFSREPETKIALARIDKALAAGIREAALYVAQARLLLTIDGSHEPLRAACAEAFKLDPACLEAFEVMAQCEHAGGNPEAEESWRTKAIEAAPGQYVLWVARGDLRAAQWNLEGALADYSKAIDLLRAMPAEYRSQLLAAVLRKRANMNEALENAEQAEQDFAKALEETPDDTTLRSVRGWFYLRKGQWQKALDDFTAVTKSGIAEGDDFYAAGIAAERLGDIGLSFAFYREAMNYRTSNYDEYCFSAACAATAMAAAMENGTLAFPCRPEAERKKLEESFAQTNEAQRKDAAKELLDSAFDLLEQLVEDYLADEDGVAKLNEEPRLERARKDPRWAALIKAAKSDE